MLVESSNNRLIDLLHNKSQVVPDPLACLAIATNQLMVGYQLNRWVKAVMPIEINHPN